MNFTLADFISQLSQIKSLGPISKVMRMIPGIGEMLRQVHMKDEQIERVVRNTRAIYDSMTTAERDDPEIIVQSHRQRIARGDGVDARDVIKLIKDFKQTRDMMHAVGSRGVTSRFATGKPHPNRVLGLVTNNRHQRDPSMIEPIFRRWSRFALLLAAIALTTLASSQLFHWLQR